MAPRALTGRWWCAAGWCSVSRLLTWFDAGVGALGGGASFTWYVDSINGDDGNTGTSPAQAFATIAALESAGISAGDSIGLARGSTWREQLDITVDNVTVAAYGSGAVPILRADNVAANASFGKTGGQTNVYEISLTPEWFGSGKDFLNIWEDDVYLTRAADLGACDSTPGSYYPSGSSGTITLYVHSSDSSDITSNGKVYEYSHRKYGLECRSASGVTITGITTMRNLHADGSMVVGPNGVITDCNCNDGSAHNILVERGCTLNNVIASGAYNTASFTLFVYNANTPSGEIVTFNNCIATVPILNAQATGFFGHKNTSGAFGTVRFNGCVAQNMAVGFNGQDAAKIEWENCQALDCNQGYRYYVGGSTITNCTYRGSVRAVDIQAAGLLTIDGLDVCLKNSSSGIGIYGTTAITVSISNSTFVRSGGTNGTCINLTNASASINASGNVWQGWADASNGFVRCYDLTNAAATLISDNNCWTLSSGFRNRVGGTDYTTVAAYQAATGQDVSSTIGGCDTSAAPCA